MEPVLLELGSDIFGPGDHLIQYNIGVESTFRFHTHNYYEFFYVTSGRALHLVNGATQIIKRGNLVFIRPSDEHAYDYYKNDDFSFYNAGISQEQFSNIVNYYNLTRSIIDDPVLPPRVQLEGETANTLNDLLFALKKTPDGQNRELLFKRIVSDVVYLIVTGIDVQDSSEYPSWLMNLLMEMEQQENFVAGLPRLLELANYSQAYINRNFQQYLYTTPTKYINNLRLRHSHHLLTTTDLPVLEISIQCGFNSISHFNTLFKQKYGICPSQYRDNRHHFKV